MQEPEVTGAAVRYEDELTNPPPLTLETMGYFFVGGRMEPAIAGSPVIGQMYVEYMVPAEQRQPYPLIMVHGGYQTGTNFTGTPDGREGWAQYFVRRGYAVYVVDQVARGRSANWADAHGPVDPSSHTSADFFESRFTAPSHYAMWPQAKLHTQFPGSGRAPDPVFLAFYNTQFPSISDYTKQQELNRDALVALLDKIGPSILMTHSQSGAFGWPVADMRPELVKAIVALEPNGPPVHKIEDGHPMPEFYRDDPAEKPYGLTSVPLTYEPPVTRDHPLRFERQASPDGPELVRCWMQASPAAKLPRIARIPIVIITCEASYHAAYDHCTSAYLTQAGVEHQFIRLEDLGIHGNGHMMMVEKNSDAIANVIASWITSALPGTG